jgi:hypothetical protein
MTGMLSASSTLMMLLDKKILGVNLGTKIGAAEFMARNECP